MNQIYCYLILFLLSNIIFAIFIAIVNPITHLRIFSTFVLLHEHEHEHDHLCFLLFLINLIVIYQTHGNIELQLLGLHLASKQSANCFS